MALPSANMNGSFSASFLFNPLNHTHGRPSSQIAFETSLLCQISETATRATGGVSSCVCTDPYKCRHNKSASYNTRKPAKDVIRLRQNVSSSKDLPSHVAYQCLSCLVMPMAYKEQPRAPRRVYRQVHTPVAHFYSTVTPQFLRNTSR